MIEEQDVRDWEEYYRNVNAFNIPNADAKRVEIWDKAFLSTKTVRETLWEVYSKGFMDGVNDTSERFKSSAFRAKHDSELLDKVVESITEIYKCNLYCAEDYCDKEQCQNAEDCFYGAIVKAIERMKAEVNK